MHHLDSAQAETDLRSLLEELKTINPDAEYVPFAADITKDGVASRLVETAVHACGKLDSLVNNAGIWYILNAMSPKTLADVGTVASW